MKKLILLLVSGLSMLALAESHNGVVYVKAGATGTGASWQDAMGDIQLAITLARTENPQARKDVWVAGGEFAITTAIAINDSVNVYGSFAGTETAVSQRARIENGNPWDFSTPTILRGSGARLVQAGGHMDMETIFDGFVLTGGNGVGSALSASGGAAVARGNVVYQNLIIRGNTAVGAGGGFIMTGGTVRHCLIESNVHTTGGNGGGGIFSNPPVGYPSYIEHNVIRNNSSTIRGAGIGVQGSEMTYVSNNRIYNNTAADGTTLKPGGGIFSNSSNNRMINNLIYNNTGVTAVYLNGGNLYNSTVVKNVGGIYLAGNVVNIANTVVWGCATDVTGTIPTSISGVANSSWNISNNATYNPIPTDKSWTTENNILLSSNVSNGNIPEPAPGTVGSGPKFLKVTNFYGVALDDAQKANLDSANWELNSTSPLVNMGKAIETVVVDFAGLNRPQGFPVAEARYDIGAYELPYYMVVAGEKAGAQGKIYSSLGELLPENFNYGYAKGTLLELFFEPLTSNEIARAYYTVSTDGGLTFTGKEVEFTDEIDTDGFWRTNVNESFKVSVVWIAGTSTTVIGTAGLRIQGLEGSMHISGLEAGEAVNVFSLSGVLVKSRLAESTELQLEAEAGMYLVRTASGVAKVIVR